MINYLVLNSHDAEQGDIDEFVRLVREGAAVQEHHVRNGIERNGSMMVLAKIDNTIVGVAALKIPLQNYRNGIESVAKSGYPIPEEIYPFELGYVAVDRSYGRKGIGERLVRKVIAQSAGRGLFATTSHPAMKKVLQRAGFRPRGNFWKNRVNIPLQLYTLLSDQ